MNKRTRIDANGPIRESGKYDGNESNGANSTSQSSFAPGSVDQSLDAVSRVSNVMHLTPDVIIVIGRQLDFHGWTMFGRTCHRVHTCLARRGPHTVDLVPSILASHRRDEVAAKLYLLSPTVVAVRTCSSYYDLLVLSMVHNVTSIRKLCLDSIQPTEYGQNGMPYHSAAQMTHRCFPNLRSLVWLESLEMSLLYVDDRTCQLFGEMCAALPNLARLTLRVFSFGEALARELQRSVSARLTHLTVLDTTCLISSSSRDEDVDGRAAFLTTFVSIQTLAVHLKYTSEFCSRMGEYWPHLRELVCYELCGCPSVVLPHLQKLSVRACSADIVLQWLRTQPTLREAVFDGCSLSKLDNYTSTGVIVAPALESLSLARCELDNTGFLWLMCALQSPRLTSLCVKSNAYLNRIPTRFGFGALLTFSMYDCNLLSFGSGDSDSSAEYSQQPLLRSFHIGENPHFTDIGRLATIFPALTELDVPPLAATANNMARLRTLPLVSLNLEACKNVSIEAMRFALDIPSLRTFHPPELACESNA
jgi:hypothetical protein